MKMNEGIIDQASVNEVYQVLTTGEVIENVVLLQQLLKTISLPNYLQKLSCKQENKKRSNRDIEEKSDNVTDPTDVKAPISQAALGLESASSPLKTRVRLQQRAS